MEPFTGGVAVQAGDRKFNPLGRVVKKGLHCSTVHIKKTIKNIYLLLFLSYFLLVTVRLFVAGECLNALRI